MLDVRCLMLEDWEVRCLMFERRGRGKETVFMPHLTTFTPKMKSEIISTLQRFKTVNQDKYQILELGLFGSIATGLATPQSDIDIVVKLKKQSLWHIIGIKQDLEELLVLSVDVVSYRDKMNPFLKRRIDENAIYV